jgi:UDP-glucose/GDP-mannose dehydrogenase family, NAD binding domain
VTVIGTGHVGLVTAASRAPFGHDVFAADADAEGIDILRRHEPALFEPGLAELVDGHVSAGRLMFEHESVSVLRCAEVVVICVGTPATPEGETNLAAVEWAASDIARHADDGAVVVGKSTVPAGKAERIGETLNRARLARLITVEGVVDAVVYLASPTSPRDYFGPPIRTLKVGSLATLKRGRYGQGLRRLDAAYIHVGGPRQSTGEPQPETYGGSVNPVGRRGDGDRDGDGEPPRPALPVGDTGLERLVAWAFEAWTS